MAVTIPTRKISEMTTKATLANNDLFPIVDSEDSDVTTQNKKILWSTVKSAAQSGLQPTLTVEEPLALESNEISIPVATASTDGYLASTDFTTFNGKADVQIVDSSPTSPLTIAANTVYKFGSAITELTISNRVTDTQEVEIQFTTGATFSFTATAWANYWIDGAPTFSANKSYVIAFKNGYGAWGEIA